MADEAQYPSKWTIAAVFTVIILMIVGVFAWAFWLNVGNIVVSADHSFTLDANGETHDCSGKSCSLSLPPKTYTMIAHSIGYYDETFTADVARWSDLEKAISFRVIPYLKSVTAQEVPPVDSQKIHFTKEQNGAMRLVLDQDSVQKVVTTFGSLKDPKVQMVGDLAVVTDEGRVFFVTVSDGRKLRRFDDSVTIHDALLSDDGKKILFFVKSNGVNALWLWFNEGNELTPLSWYAPPESVQWERSVNHRLFVISDELMPTEHSSDLEKVLGSVQTARQQPALFQVNLDTNQVVQLASFDTSKVPSGLVRRGDRYFIDYTGGVFDELVVK